MQDLSTRPGLGWPQPQRIGRRLGWPDVSRETPTPDVPARAEPESRVHEAVNLALELGVDPNVANLDGRTALDAARALKNQSVVNVLTERGARSGQP